MCMKTDKYCKLRQASYLNISDELLIGKQSVSYLYVRIRYYDEFIRPIGR
jgi:hypothetical protein